MRLIYSIFVVIKPPWWLDITPRPPRALYTTYYLYISLNNNRWPLRALFRRFFLPLKFFLPSKFSLKLAVYETFLFLLFLLILFCESRNFPFLDLSLLLSFLNLPLKLFFLFTSLFLLFLSLNFSLSFTCLLNFAWAKDNYYIRVISIKKIIF